MKRDWKDRAISSLGLVFGVAKGAAEVFGPLKAVLESVSTIYAQYKACLSPYVKDSF